MKATKPSTAPTGRRARPRASTGQDPLAVATDFGRQQAIVATESASALFRGFEAIRKIQEETAHKASERHADAASRLRGNCTPADVLAVQADLLRYDIEAASSYWQSIAAAALEMQSEIADCATHLMNTEALLAGSSAVDAIESRVPGLEAFLTVFPTLRKAYEPHAEAS